MNVNALHKNIRPYEWMNSSMYQIPKWSCFCTLVLIICNWIISISVYLAAVAHVAAAAAAADVAALYACNERDRLQFQRVENKVAKPRGSMPIGATMLQTHRTWLRCCCHISLVPMIEILRPVSASGIVPPKATPRRSCKPQPSAADLFAWESSTAPDDGCTATANLICAQRSVASGPRSNVSRSCHYVQLVLGNLGARKVAFLLPSDDFSRPLCWGTLDTLA